MEGTSLRLSVAWWVIEFQFEINSFTGPATRAQRRASGPSLPVFRSNCGPDKTDYMYLHVSFTPVVHGSAPLPMGMLTAGAGVWGDAGCRGRAPRKF